jgi:replicative DNA helicase
MKSGVRNAERSFISSVLNSGDIVAAQEAGIDGSWFREYGRHWKFIEERWRSKKRVPSVAVFKDRYPSFVMMDVDDVEYSITKLRRYHSQQTLLSIINDITTGIEDDDDLQAMLPQLNQNLVTLAGQLAGQDREVDMVGDWHKMYGELIKRKKRVQDGKQIGITTGWPTVDHVLGGWQPGHLISIGARLNVGKTWALIKTAAECVAAGGTVQFHTLEMGRHDVSIRSAPFLSRLVGQEAGTIMKSSELSRGKGDLKAVKTFFTNTEFGTGKLIIDDTPRGKLDMMSLAAKIQRNEPDLVIIDYIQLLSGKPGDWALLAQLSADLKGIATDFYVPVIAASQLNRTSGLQSDAGAEAISGADAIGHDADFMMFVHPYSLHTRKCTVVKNRHGENDKTFYTEFDVNTGVFDEIGKQRADDIKDQDKDAS